MSKFKEAILSLSSGANFKPHKYIALLAMIKILAERNFEDSTIYYDENFRESFTYFFNQFARQSDRNRAYAPFFYLRSSGLITLVPNEGVDLSKVSNVGSPKDLRTYINHAVLQDDFFNALKKVEQRIEIIQEIYSILKHTSVAQEPEQVSLLSKAPLAGQTNPTSFLNYLASLQRLGGSNENALAENQACNPHFSHIAVKHPRLDAIVDDLRQGHCHVVLTGHAGDGKSTLGIAAYKKLTRHADDAPLQKPLTKNFFFNDAYKDYFIIKDLSEHNPDNHGELFQDFCQKDCQGLLVSNTGALLDFFLSKQQAKRDSRSALEIESALLRCMESVEPQIFHFAGEQFKIYNLALQDNLDSARAIFSKMVHEDRWQSCTQCEKKANCPIHKNRITIADHPCVLDRITSIYRRIQAYGTRLTLRQLTEHFTYALTGGLTKEQCCDSSMMPSYYQKYAFFNLFFGDDAVQKNADVSEMTTIQALEKQGLGQRPLCGMTKELWHTKAKTAEHFGIPPVLQEHMQELLKNGRRHTDSQRASMARLQIYRLLYFCYDGEHKDIVQREFLDSPAMVLWQQIPDISRKKLSVLGEQVYHVLLEHCTGLCLPESIARDDRKRLFLTMNRLHGHARQSVQAVYGSISWDDNFSIEMEGEGSTAQLWLQGEDRASHIRLSLDVPFLDFILRRSEGRLGSLLQSSFVQRLDAFKAEVAPLCRRSRKDTMTLLRYLSDYSLKEQKYTFSRHGLEAD